MFTIAWVVSVGMEVESFARDEMRLSLKSAISIALGIPGPALILSLNNWTIMKTTLTRFEAMFLLAQMLLSFSSLCVSFHFDGKMPYVLMVGFPSALCLLFSDALHPFHRYGASLLCNRANVF